MARKPTVISKLRRSIAKPTTNPRNWYTNIKEFIALPISVLALCGSLLTIWLQNFRAYADLYISISDQYMSEDKDFKPLINNGYRFSFLNTGNRPILITQLRLYTPQADSRSVKLIAKELSEIEKGALGKQFAYRFKWENLGVNLTCPPPTAYADGAYWLGNPFILKPQEFTLPSKYVFMFTAFKFPPNQSLLAGPYYLTCLEIRYVLPNGTVQARSILTGIVLRPQPNPFGIEYPLEFTTFDKEFHQVTE